MTAIDHRQVWVDGFAARSDYYRAELSRRLRSYDAGRQLDRLLAVRILWLDRNLLLWGLPYERLRPGQSPRDIAEGPVGKRDFICLHGMPVHSGSLALLKHFLDAWRQQGVMPGYAFEWSYVEPIGRGLETSDLVAASDAETASLTASP